MRVGARWPVLVGGRVRWRSDGDQMEIRSARMGSGDLKREESRRMGIEMGIKNPIEGRVSKLGNFKFGK